MFKKKLKLGSKKDDDTLFAEPTAKTRVKKKSKKMAGTGDSINSPSMMKSPSGTQKKQVKSSSESDDPFDDLFEVEEVGAITQAAIDRGQKEVAKVEAVQAHIDKTYGVGRSGQRVLTVKLGYNSVGLHEGQMIMEVCSMRETIPADWGVAEWRGYMDTVGAVPSRITFGDVDRWHKLLFASEYLRMWETADDQKIHGQWRPDGDWDPTAENVEQDGRTIGSIDIDDPFAELFEDTPDVAPVREQMESVKQANVEKNRPDAKPMDLDAIRAVENNPEEQMWVIAKEFANKPRAEWEGKVDWMLEQRIKYCYGWLADVGEVPKPYPANLLDIFWPVTAVDNHNKEKVLRRHDITSKVLSFWRNSVEKNGEGMSLKSESYRTTLAAMEMQKAIEAYVSAGSKFNMQNEIQDKAEEMGVQQAAKKYFQAHFPIADLGAGPGPLSTMDPDYITYIRLCRQYSIPQGSLLHEVKL